jgi:hypothetical protein
MLYDKLWSKGLLLPPYTKAEIEDYERKLQFVFPKLLRHYLLNISRESVVGCYSVEIKLYEDLGENKMITNDHIRDRYIIDDDDGNSAEDGTLWIGDNGCAFDSYVVVKGTGTGYVLEHCDYDYNIKPLWEYLREPSLHSKRAPWPRCGHRRSVG